jgi:hypothetical protein
MHFEGMVQANATDRHLLLLSQLLVFTPSDLFIPDFIYSFPTLLINARLPIPLMSMYTMTTFVAVPVNSDTVFAASGPYLKKYLH